MKILSELAYIKGNNEAETSAGILKVSTQIFPLSSESYYGYGKFLLDRYSKSKNNKDLTESRRMFKRSLSINNLNFSSHFLLGRSYLADDSADPGDFEKGLRLLKNASTIRKTNLGVNVNTIKIYLSLWPFLSEENRDTAASLMKLSIPIPTIGRQKFSEIMEVWGFYSKDPAFLNSILNEKGKYYSAVHKELIKHELELKFRFKLLTQSEYLLLKKAESDRSEFGGDTQKTIALYKRLNTEIKGYYKFVKDSRFRETLLFKLKKELLNRVVKDMLEDLNPENISEIIALASSYLDQFDQTRDIELLDDLLRQKKFYNSNDIKVFYLKQLINFKTGQVSKMISETEGFRQSVSFVREGQEEEYSKLLALLVDAYRNSRLLTKAVDVLKDIEKIVPGSMSTYWRLIRIESIIGEEEYFADKKARYFDKIKNSNNILLNKQKVRAIVYPYEIDNLILSLDEAFSEKFREFHLLQVFINGKIFHESYIEELTFPIELPLEGKFKKEKFEVEINLVK